MKKKILLMMGIICLSLSITGCGSKHDMIEVMNKSYWTIDNILIPIKEGYFYNKHEKFTVDENTVGVTIYFSNDAEDGWK